MVVAPVRPHIVLLMADHLRRDCLSCYGDLPVRTPHLDRLASRSVVFDRAYCAAPLCGPTRVSMYTGQWPHVHGAVTNGEPGHDRAGPEHESLYELLSRGGYGITHVGVDHCRLNPSLRERVPDALIDYHDSWNLYADARGIPRHPNQIPAVAANRVPCCAGSLEGAPVSRLFHRPRALRYPFPAEDFLDVHWSRRAVELIERLDFSSPQYVEVLFWAPHPPFVVPEPYASLYDPSDIDLPETVGRWYPGQPASLLLDTPGQLGNTIDREEYRRTWAGYFGLVTMVDQCIGRVIAALEARGVWDESLVVFIQDHGEMLGSHALCQKHCFYEEAARLPLLVKPPGGTEADPVARSQLVSGLDYFATVCDYAGIEPPRTASRSFRAAVEHAGAAGRKELFMEYHGDVGRSRSARAVVTDLAGVPYKLIHTVGDRDELYDLAADPLETRSLSGEASHETRRADLIDRLCSWMDRTADTAPRPG